MRRRSASADCSGDTGRGCRIGGWQQGPPRPRPAIRWQAPARAAVDELLELLVRGAAILNQHELLAPTRLAFECRFEPGEHPIAEGTTKLAVASVDAIVDTGHAALDRLEALPGFHAVLGVNVFGAGTGLYPDGTRKLIPDLVWLSGGTLGFHLIDVNTQSDIWLPYSLRAEPQAELAGINAPRLEIALRAFEGLPVVAVPSDPTPFAIPSGRSLVNHIDHDGKIGDVIWDDNLVAPEEEA
jgi:hypothetical protein